MATELNIIQVDINDDLPDIKAVQYDHNSRIVRFEFTDKTADNGDSDYIDLTGCSATLIIQKPSGAPVMIDGVLLDAVNGQCEFALTEQATAEIGKCSYQVLFIKSENNERLCSRTGTISVSPCLSENDEITSSTELSALTTALAGVQNAAEAVAALEAIHVGNISTLEPGTEATASFDKKSGELSFGIPRGEAGASAYLHIRYANTSSGNNFTSTPSNTRKYIGVAVTNSPTAPTAPSNYNWSKFIGENGATGASVSYYLAADEAEAQAYSAANPDKLCYWLG